MQSEEFFNDISSDLTTEYLTLEQKQSTLIPKFERLWEIVEALNKAWEKILSAKKSEKIKILTGVKAYVSGGAVRDLVARQLFNEDKIRIQDFDIVLIVPYEVVEEVIKNGKIEWLSQPYNNKYLIWIKEKDNTQLEVSIYFSNSSDILKERVDVSVDITANGLYIPITKGGANNVVLSFHGGIGHIQALQIKTIQPPTVAFGQLLVFSQERENNRTKVYKMMRILRILDLVSKYSYYNNQFQWNYDHLQEIFKQVSIQFEKFIDTGTFSKQFYKSLTNGYGRFFLEKLKIYDIAKYIFPNFLSYSDSILEMATLIDNSKVFLEPTELHKLMLWPSFYHEYLSLNSNTPHQFEENVEIAANNIVGLSILSLKNSKENLKSEWYRIIGGPARFTVNAAFDRLIYQSLKFGSREKHKVTGKSNEPNYEAQRAFKEEFFKLVADAEPKFKNLSNDSNSSFDKTSIDSPVLETKLLNPKTEVKIVAKKGQPSKNSISQEEAEKLQGSIVKKNQKEPVRKTKDHREKQEAKISEAETKVLKAREEYQKQIAKRRVSAEAAKKRRTEKPPKKAKENALLATHKPDSEGENTVPIFTVNSANRLMHAYPNKIEKEKNKVKLLLEFQSTEKRFSAMVYESAMFFKPVSCRNMNNAPSVGLSKFINGFHLGVAAIFLAVETCLTEKTNYLNAVTCLSIISALDNIIDLSRRFSAKQHQLLDNTKITDLGGELKKYRGYLKNVHELIPKFQKLAKLYEQHNELLKLQNKFENYRNQEENACWVIAAYFSLFAEVIVIYSQYRNDDFIDFSNLTHLYIPVISFYVLGMCFQLLSDNDYKNVFDQQQDQLRILAESETGIIELEQDIADYITTITAPNPLLESLTPALENSSPRLS